ncbi:LamG domain-containing protein, partial [bacterium]|nr:LamG domain-containing protein [bacterium]
MQKDPHFYDGAHIWSEWGDQWDNMGLPRFFPAGTYDPRAHTIERRGFVHGKANIGHRYYIENLAAFLDTPGEYYYDAKGAHPGRLHIRLPDDRDPNQSVVELGREVNLIDIRDQSHIAITGLRFSFMNLPRGDDPMTIFANPAVYGRAVAVRLMGDCRGIRVANCRFLHVPGAVQGSPRISPDMLNWPYADLKAKTTRDLMDEIEITDNDIDHADAVAIELQDGGAGYGRKNDELLIGELGRVHILRNRVHDAVFRNGASGNGPAIGVTCASLVEIAGNFIDRAWGVGIWCLGGKGGGDERNRPLIRNLVHHNKLTNVLLGCNDWGGMAIWQGGSSYAYCNIVYNPLGLKHMIKAGGLPWRIQEWSCNGFAYYLDGTYKSYIFNNIAWGKFNDLDNWLKNRSAFMMVLGFQNNWFNNTVYKFCYGVTGSSGQRNTMLGNIFADISNKFFGQDAPGDISLHMGQIAAGRSAEKTSAASTLAYGFNVYYGTPTSFGRLVGKDTAADIEAFRRGLADATPRAGDVGVMSPDMPLADPDKGDFRPRPGSVAAGRGVRFFVPWSLYMTVGEWSFTRFNADPTVVLGENFFMSDEYVTREMYYEIPRNDLTAVGAKAEDYVKGALEDWTDGALMFNGRDRFCILKDRELKSDYPVTQAFVEDKGKREQRNGTFTYPGSKRRTVDMGVNSFLIEAYQKTTAGLTGAVVVSKAAESGYVLDIGSRGRVRLTIRAGGKEACSRTSSVAVNDGKWHHVIAEVDRAAREGIAIYVDGKAANGTFTGLMPDGNVSLKNSADFLVGKGAAGGFFAGAIDFLRVCRG